MVTLALVLMASGLTPVIPQTDPDHAALDVRVYADQRVGKETLRRARFLCNTAYYLEACHAHLGRLQVPASSSKTPPPLSGEPVLPANLIVPAAGRPTVIAMWRRSPTFRRQCARLAEHSAVTVRIEFAVAMPHWLAEACVARRGASLDVVVRVAFRKPGLYAEHIAHELEHVLEYVDGTDLPKLARQRLDGVVDLGGQYETARTRSVGRTVAVETMR
jgi:hypothetical protein